MKNIAIIKQLLEKHLARTLSSQETEELFDRLRTINNPRELDHYMANHWKGMDVTDGMAGLTWEQILEENSHSNQRIANRKKPLTTRHVWSWSIAASLLIMMSLVWWNWNHDTDYITYRTNYGETKAIELDDGTSVVLNANSELKWKYNWKSNKTRFAQLRGEAYFEVAHIDMHRKLDHSITDSTQKMPFQVVTSDVVIDVLGTAFNVADRRGKTQVYLEEGAVKLGLLGGQKPETGQKRSSIHNIEELKSSLKDLIVMKPGEMILYSAETQNVQKILSKQPNDRTEWKDGTLVFHNVIFGEMLDQMEDIYGTEFIVNDAKLLAKHVSFGIPYKNWETVKELMEKSLRVEIIKFDDNRTVIRKR